DRERRRACDSANSYQAHCQQRARHTATETSRREREAEQVQGQQQRQASQDSPQATRQRWARRNVGSHGQFASVAEGGNQKASTAPNADGWPPRTKGTRGPRRPRVRITGRRREALFGLRFSRGCRFGCRLSGGLRPLGPRAALAGLGLAAAGLFVRLVAGANELDDRHVGGVTEPGFGQLVNARVATVTGGKISGT